MFIRCILFLSSILPVSETCLATIAPEEYYPTASLPPLPTTQMTVEPTTVEATTEEVETTTVTTTTTTVDPDLCNKCNFDAIAPRLLQNNVEYAASDEHPVDGCERKQVLCKRSDRQQCTTVQMFATTADTSVSISMLTTATMVFANIDCDNEGNLSYKGTVNGIEQITCNLEGCALYSNG